MLQVVATNDRQSQQITSQLNKIQEDMAELKRDGVHQFLWVWRWVSVYC